MRIKSNVLDRQYLRYAQEYNQAATDALKSGWYILGSCCERFEQEFAAFTGAKFCVGLNSGLDALVLAVRALGIGPGDEVIIPANTYIATALGVSENGAVPVFVEPDQFFNMDAEKIEDAITDKTKAIIAVHLYGQAADMRRIKDIADLHGIYLLEDCAQSHGAAFEGQMTGTFGDAGCFSFYPTKNLGAFGDSGAVVTNSADMAERFRMLRNYGSRRKYYNETLGVNSRLDEIQAALLSVKLSHLEELTKERIQLARRYDSGIKNREIMKPQIRKGADHVYHQYVIRTGKRAELQEYLNRNEIETQIHYPIPPHLAECYAYLGHKAGSYLIAEQAARQVLSLPLYNGMTIEEQDYVIETLNGFNAQG